MDWIFHYDLSRKILCDTLVNSADISFIKDPRNHLQGFNIHVQNADFADAELIGKKKSSNLRKLLIVKSGMETNMIASAHEGIPKKGGFKVVGKTFRSGYSIEGKIDKLDLLDSNIQKLVRVVQKLHLQ
jgi:hypothetical protein